MFTTEILEKLDLFGPYLIFLLIFLEGLNLTGIPAIVIMPAIGFSIYTSSYSFFFIYLISVLAAILACLAYYAVSYKFGGALYDFFYQKYGHKFFAIRHKTILGIYDNFDNALADNISKGFPVGTFIVQECTGDESGYTVCVTSWRPA